MARHHLLRYLVAFVLGLCLHSYHSCDSVTDAHPFFGACGSTTLPPPPTQMWPLLELIVVVVERCVMGYFVTFIVCWKATLGALTTMIDQYFVLLRAVTVALTAWPTNLLVVIGLAISLLGVALILEDPATSYLDAAAGSCKWLQRSCSPPPKETPRDTHSSHVCKAV